MKKIYILLIIFIIAGFSFANNIDGNSDTVSKKTAVICQDFVIKAVNGKVSYDKGKDQWFFAPDEDITDSSGFIKSNTKTALLKCAALEQMANLYHKSKITDFKLWANVNYYNGSNNLFPVYFLPLQKNTGSEDNHRKNSKTDETAKDSDNYNVLPADILQKLQPERIVSNQKIQQVLNSPEDAVLISRTGFLYYDKTNNQYIIRLDGLGRNSGKMSFIVHENMTLTKAKILQNKTPQPTRLRFSGRITTFENNHYIQLHSVSIAYSYGNFGR